MKHDKEIQKLYEGIADIAHHEPTGNPGEYSMSPVTSDELLDRISNMAPGTERSHLIDLLVKREYMKIMKRIRGQRSDSIKALRSAKNIVKDMLDSRGII